MIESIIGRMVKVLFTTLLVTSFVGIAVFGAFAMNHDSGHAASGCIAATAKAANCSEETTPFALADFHISAFKSFSSAVFGGALLATLLSMLLAGLVFFAPPLLKLVQFSPACQRFSSPQKQEFTRWLSLHENSPTV